MKRPSRSAGIAFALSAVIAGTAFAQAQEHQHPPPAPTGQAEPGAQHQHEGHEPKQTPPADVPPLTDEDRRAAFPEVGNHPVHDSGLHYFVLFDQLEWHVADSATGFDLDTRGWVGGDLDRFWFRGEADADRGETNEAQAHALYGRAVARWWDVVAGVRQDIRPGPAQTWAAVGVQGLAPYWFEIEATGYVGESLRTQLRLEVEYELLITNRVIVQPLIELELYGKSIPERGIGAGLSATNMGVRLRYEIRRELAPYIGITWNRKWGGTADFLRGDGDEVSRTRLALGLRAWF